MSDEDLYLRATNEVETEKRDPALWAKAMTLAEGDEQKAKYKYIATRVEQMGREASTSVQSSPSVVNHSLAREQVFQKITQGVDPANIEHRNAECGRSDWGTAVKEPTGLFSKLARGQFGLAKTFWFYGVLVNVVVGLLWDLLFNFHSFFGVGLLAVVYSLYSIPFILGLWRASNICRDVFWAGLVKVVVVLEVISRVSILALTASFLFKIFTPFSVD